MKSTQGSYSNEFLEASQHYYVSRSVMDIAHRENPCIDIGLQPSVQIIEPIPRGQHSATIAPSTSTVPQSVTSHGQTASTPRGQSVSFHICCISRDANSEVVDQSQEPLRDLPKFALLASSITCICANYARETKKAQLFSR